MNKLVIGVDFGSDSVRAALVDLQGNILTSTVFEYPRWKAGKYCDAQRSIFRQHPLDYLEGIETVIKGVMVGVDPAAVVGIGMDTTGSTPCMVDANGTPLALLPEFAEDPDAMFYLWKDHSSLQEASEINAAAAQSPVNYTKYSGGAYSAEWFWAKLLHILRVNPKVAAAGASFVEHCDWLPAELTGGELHPSRCAAGHKAMWHEDWGGLPPEEFLVAVDPLLAGWRKKLYDRTYTAEVPVGTLSAKWAEKLGLTTSVVVSGGAIDCHFGAVGAGIRAGQLVKVVGTSTCDIAVAPQVDKCIRGICGQVDGSVVPGMIGMEAGQSAFGDIYAWFKRFISYGGEVTLPQLEKEAQLLSPEDAGVALDWHNGRRSPDANQLLTGAIFGLTLGTTPAMVYRSLVEATAFGSRMIVERLLEEGVTIQQVVAIGGIAQKSPLVMQICADVLGMPIKIAKSDQVCALGAAIFAATAAGCYPNTTAAMDAMASATAAEYRPDPQRHQQYLQKFRQYRSLGQAVESVVNQG